MSHVLSSFKLLLASNAFNAIHIKKAPWVIHVQIRSFSHINVGICDGVNGSLDLQFSYADISQEIESPNFWLITSYYDFQENIVNHS